MTQKDDTARTGRRGFLKLAGTAAPLAAVAAVSGGAADAGPALPDLQSDKMQDTVHTRAYFDSARF